MEMIFLDKMSEMCLLICLDPFDKFLWCGVGVVVATFGSILDSQLSWESDKFQLAGWSQEVRMFLKREPPSHPPGR